MSLLGLLGVGGGLSFSSYAQLDDYLIEKSLRLDAAYGGYLTKKYPAGMDAQKFTISVWVKPSASGRANGDYILGYTNGASNGSYIMIDWQGLLCVYFETTNGSPFYMLSADRYIDSSAWMHVYVKADLTQSLAADKCQVKVNGVDIDVTGTSPTWGNQNDTFSVWPSSAAIDTNNGLAIGDWPPNNKFSDLLLADMFILNDAKDVSEFAQIDSSSGIWVPKKYSSTYTSFDSYLNFDGDGKNYSSGISGSEQTPATYPKEKMFDGNPATAYLPSNSSTATWTPVGGLTFNSTLKLNTFHSSLPNVTANQKVTFNWSGGSYTLTVNDASGPTWYDVSSNVTSPVTSITWTTDSNGEGPFVYGVEVDGKVLVDHTGIETDSSGNGNNWNSHYLTDTGGTVNYANSISNSPYLPINAFSSPYIFTYLDYNLSTITNTAWEGAYDAGNNTNVFTPPGGLSVTSSFVLYYGAYNNSTTTTTLLITYTDTSTETDSFISGTNNWMGSYTATSAAGKTIQSISISNPSAHQSFGAFIIDGVLLESYDPRTDVSLDTPTNYGNTDTGVGGEVGGNHATINPLGGFGQHTLSDGNLQITTTSVTGYEVSRSTISTPLSGKWYAEMKVTSQGNGGSSHQVGLISSDSQFADGYDMGSINLPDGTSGAVYYYAADGTTKTCGVTGSGGNTWGLDDVIGIAYNADDHEVIFYKNGVAQASNFNVPLHPYVFGCSEYNNTSVNVYVWNFGQRKFAYPAPSGYKCLCTQNLPDPTIKDPSKQFDVATYSGLTSLVLADTSIDTSTAYRYHRILFEGDSAGGAVSELEFYDINGDKIDASDPNNAGGTVASNENQSTDPNTPSLDAWTAFNGIRGGASYTDGVRKDASTGFYISKDWGSGQTKKIYGVKVWGVHNYGLAGITAGKYMKLQGSSDNTNWTTLQTWNSARYGTWTTSSSTDVAHISDQTLSDNILSAANAVTDGADFVWIKDRDNNDSNNSSDYSILFNRINDPEMDGTPHLRSSETDTEATCGTYSAPSGNSVAWVWNAGDANTSVSAGGMDASLLDKSQAWATAGTITGGTASNYDWPGVFNEYAQHVPWKIASGGGGNACHPSGGGVTTKYEFASSGLTGVTSIKLSVIDHADGSIILNEGEADEVTFTATASNVAKMYEDTTITTLKSISNVGGSTTGHALFGVMVNGKALIDSGNSYTIPTIPSTYRANPSAGFSIVSYEATGTLNQSLAHGLNAKPDFMILKSRDSSANWNTWHKDYTTNQQKVLYMNLDNGGDVYSGGSSTWWHASPDSNVLWYGESGSSINLSNGNKMIAYCWSEVEGYSKFGMYTGIYNSPTITDGPFVHTGFRPRFIMIKRTDNSGHWLIYDTERESRNVMYKPLTPSREWSEMYWPNSGANHSVSALSNGFKIDGGPGELNANTSATYIFAAFAEQPFKHARAR